MSGTRLRRALRSWKPSPNDQAKQRVADELRHEIEAKWPGAQEIVIRDFNLKDNQITTYLKMPDGDYYQGCGFHAKNHSWTFSSNPYPDRFPSTMTTGISV